MFIYDIGDIIGVIVCAPLLLIAVLGLANSARVQREREALEKEKRHDP